MDAADQEYEPLRPLTAEQEKFVSEYLVDHNATRAYIAAYGNRKDGKPRSRQGAARCACDLLKTPHVKAEIKAAEAFISRRNRVTADRVMKELAAIAFSNAGDVFDFGVSGIPVPKNGRDIPETARKAISQIKLDRRTSRDRDGEPVVEETVSYRFHSKQAALDKLYAHLGMDPEANQLQVLLGMLPYEIRKQVLSVLDRTTNSGSRSGDAGELEGESNETAG